MPDTKIVVKGDEAIAFLEKLRSQLQRMPRVFVGSDLIYSYGIEHGRHRSGKLARAAGGAFYLAGAVQVVTRDMAREIIVGLQDGNIVGAFQRIGFRVETEAKSRTPVITGSLRRLLHTVME